MSASAWHFSVAVWSQWIFWNYPGQPVYIFNTHLSSVPLYSLLTGSGSWHLPQMSISKVPWSTSYIINIYQKVWGFKAVNKLESPLLGPEFDFIRMCSWLGIPLALTITGIQMQRQNPVQQPCQVFTVSASKDRKVSMAGVWQMWRGVAAECPWVPLMHRREKHAWVYSQFTVKPENEVVWQSSWKQRAGGVASQAQDYWKHDRTSKETKSSQRRNKIPGLEVRMPKVFRSIGLCRKCLPLWWLVETPSPLHLKTFQIMFLHEAGAT